VAQLSAGYRPLKKQFQSSLKKGGRYLHIKLYAPALLFSVLLLLPAWAGNIFLPPILLWAHILFCLGAGLYCVKRASWHKAACFIPLSLAVALLFWEYAHASLLPGIAALDFSRIGITDPAAEIARARNALHILSLLPCAALIYLSRRTVLSAIKRPLPALASKRASPLSDQRHDESALRRIGLKKPAENITICYDRSGRPVEIADIDRYLHTLVVGSTGVGKTSRVLKPMLEQEIKNIRSSLARQIPRGLTVIEPKGDLAADISEMAAFYGVPCVYVDPLRVNSARFNPLEGEPPIVAEAIRTVLRATFGRQEAFYSWVQEVAARNVVLLLKYNRQNNVTMQNMLELLRNHKLLREEANSLRSFMDSIDRRLARAQTAGDSRQIQWLEYLKSMETRVHELIAYFDMEVLNEKLSDKYQQFALGLRLQVDDIVGNEYLGRVVGGESDINLDVHLNRGGVFVVNTAMSHLGKLGDTFGQFVIMHFQNAVFRREGNEFTRARHMLVIDEAHRYINPDFERLLAMGRSFRCECVLALQNIAQFALDEKRSFQDSVLNLCRNKIVFGGMDSRSAKYFSAELGETETTSYKATYSANLLYKKPWDDRRVSESEEFKQRFDYTALMELPVYQVVYRVIKDGRLTEPGIGEVRLSEWDTKYRNLSPAPALRVVRSVEEPEDKSDKPKRTTDFNI
jgi:hypothetical protein